MKKNALQQKQRAEFVQAAFNNSKEAANHAAKYVRRLRKARNTTQIVQALSEMLYISEATIFREIKNKDN